MIGRALLRVVAVGAIGTALSCSSGSGPGDLLFVSQTGSASVAVIEADSGQLVQTIEVGLLPHRLLLSPDRQTLYVVLVGSQAVAEVDTRTLSLRRRFLTAPVPALRADGSVIQGHADRGAFTRTSCYDCHDGRAGAPEPKYPGDRPMGVLLSPDGARLLVTHLRSGDLAEIELSSGAVARAVHLAPAGAASEAVSAARLGADLFVTLRPPQPSTEAGAVRRLDPESLAERDQVPTGSDPVSIVALPGRGRLLVSNFETDTVTEQDAQGAGRALVVRPGPFGLLPLPDGRVLALDYYSNAASFLDLDAGTAGSVDLAGGPAPCQNPTHAALDAAGRLAWIVCSGPEGRLVALDLERRRVARTAPVAGLSFDIAVLPGWAR